MARRAISAIRAIWQDARRRLDEDQFRADPPPHLPRNETMAGAWPGAPFDKLPPDCPVVPLGKTGDVSYLIDTLGQLAAVPADKWGNKRIIDLFATSPNYPAWAWPRLSKPDKKGMSKILGMDGEDAVRCLVNACARRGPFEIAERVRGRGGWATRGGLFIWHSGDALWMVDGGRLRATRPAEWDDALYPRRPPIVTPWEEPVGEDDSPVPELLAAFSSFSFERPAIDPFLLIGAIGCALAGAALDWRPTIFMTGDRGVGKSTLQAMIKAVLDEALLAAADTTAAGIYQQVNQDSLPVSVDELEADASNQKTRAVLSLARLASSGAMMFRGGADHTGTQFRARNVYFFSAINPPPLTTAEKSRIGMINLGRLDNSKAGGSPPVVGDHMGRQILRQMMDRWPRFAPSLADWKETLWKAGFDGRAQATYGTLLAMAELLAGAEAMEEAGLPVTEQAALGAMIRAATDAERAEQSDNWRDCLDHILGSTIEGRWAGGEQPTVGRLLEDYETKPTDIEFREVQKRLALAGLGGRLKVKGKPEAGYLLAVPPKGKALNQLFRDTIFGDGVWYGALKQAPAAIVARPNGNDSVVKINKATYRCLMIDLAAYEREAEGEG